MGAFEAVGEGVEEVKVDIEEGEVVEGEATEPPKTWNVPKRRTSSIFPNMSIRKLLLNSTAVEKVSLHLVASNSKESNRWTRVVGVLKGYDQLMNLVLDDVKELLRGEVDAEPAPNWEC